MTEHAWVQEQIAAFLADGLDAAEAERFRTHVRECAECATAVDAAKAFDAGLANLFASARPGPMLEDRTVRALRTPTTLAAPRRGVWRRRVVTGLAASLLVGGLTAGGAFLVANGGLPMPGEEFAWKKAKTSDALSEAAMVRFEDATADSRTRWYRNAAVERERADDFDEVGKNLESAGVAPLDVKNGTAPNSTHRNAWNDTYSLGRVKLSDMNGQPVGKDAPPPTEGENLFGTMAAGSPGTQNFRYGKDASGKATGTTLGVPFRSGDGVLAGGNGRFDPNAYFAIPALSQATRSVGGAPATARGDVVSKSPPASPRGANDFAKSDFVAADPQKPVPPEAQAARKIIIRSGDIDFEVESFDPAIATVTQLVTKITGGYVGTVNSEKLANGKVKGTIVVRVPPDALDGLVLDLRKELGKAGELKGQRIGSSDVTKQFTDTESRLKAARAMETRLLAIIKDGKGEIKQLLEAEKELGVWRTKIEEYEGELRYYSSLAALSTLTITLAEKDIRVAAGITENERVQAGIEVEDVDQAFRDALAAVAEAKGRVTKSELKQLAAGQFNALVFFEVAPDAAGPLRDRLKQLGRVARLEIDRVQTADGGPPTKDAKVKRGDTTFQVQFYNLANVAPRETAVVQVATADVAATFRTLRDAVEKAKGRVVTAQVSEGERQNVSAQFDFEVKRTEEASVLAALAAAGDVVSRTVSRAPESDGVTDTKVAFRTTLFNAARLKPRETATLAVEVTDVEGTAAVLTAQVTDAKGRVVDSQVSHDRGGKMTARLVYDVPLPAAAGVVEKAKAAGTVRVQQSNRDPAATEGKFATARIEVTLSNTDPIVAKEDGVWPQVRKGLTYSASALLSSLTWVTIGLCVVLPWVVLIYLIARVLRRFVRPTPTPVPPPPV